MPLSFPGPVVSASVATTSGATIDFTGIPTGVKRVSMLFDGMSTTGTSAIGFQLGPDAAVETTGYNGAGIAFGNTVVGSLLSFTNIATIQAGSGTGSAVWYGEITFRLRDATNNIWVWTSMGWDSFNVNLSMATGKKALAGVLGRVRLTTTGGTDTFDAGSITIVYER